MKRKDFMKSCLTLGLVPLFFNVRVKPSRKFNLHDERKDWHLNKLVLYDALFLCVHCRGYYSGDRFLSKEARDEFVKDHPKQCPECGKKLTVDPRQWEYHQAK